MKSSLAGNTDFLHLYPNRNYISLSTKLSTNAYSKPPTFNFNSPKNDSSKNIVFSNRLSTDPSKYFKKTEKLESTLERKNSRPEANNGTPKPSTSYMSSYAGLGPSPRSNPKLTKPEDKRISIEKPKGGISDIYSASPKYSSISTSSPKVSDSINLRESLKNELNISRPKNLEIATDYSNSRLPVATIKAVTTKNKDLNDRIPSNESYNKNIVSQYSMEFMSKFSKNLAVETTPEQGLHATEGDERAGPKSVKNQTLLTRYPNYTQERPSNLNHSTNPPTKKYQTEVQYGSNSGTSKGSSGVKINNFFNNTGGYEPTNAEKYDKLLNKTAKVELDDHNDESITKSSDLAKKVYNKTQLDLRTTLRGFSQEPDHRREKENTKNSQDSKLQDSNSKPSLQSFVTKINKGNSSDSFLFQGDIFTTVKPQSEKEESSKKPYLQLDDKYSNKTPKSGGSSLLYKPTNVAPKTTTNQEARAFAFPQKTITGTPNSNTDHSKRTSTATSVNTNSALRTSKPSTPSHKTKDNSEILSTPTHTSEKKQPHIYYISNLEKYHRNYLENDYFCQIYREHFMQTYQAMMFCRYLKPVDPKMLAQKRVFLSKKDTHKGRKKQNSQTVDKKTLVFDLDETLIHCNESADLPSDVKLPIRFPHGEIIEAGINIRPYVIDCLKELSQIYEIIVFTASHGCYANVVLDYIDPKEQYIHHRLFRESCIQTDQGIYIKDLRVLANRNLQDVVIIDNAAYSFGYQIENGIPIIPFYDNKTDRELKDLVPYLKFLATVKDLREINKQTFKLQSYSMYDSADKVLERVVFQK